MPTTTNMVMVLPTDHASLDVWGAALNAALTSRVDVHNHTTGLGVQVPVAGLNINADLSFGGTRAITNALALDMTPTAAANVTGYTSALWADSTSNSGDLTYRSPAGVNVRITNGGSLNFSVTGGIGGDYTSVGALLDFIDASDQYHFFQQVGGGVRQYARVAMGDLDLFEYKANPAVGVPTNRVRLKSPAALAASYDLTWLTALPAANQLVSVDNAGAITAGTSAAMQANANITLSGTGNYKHGTKSISWCALPNVYNISAGGAVINAGASGIRLNNNSIITFPCPPLPTHARIVNVNVYFNTAADRNGCTCLLMQTSNADPATDVFTNTGFGPTNAGTAITKFPAVNLTPTASQTYWVQISNGVSTPKVVAFVMDYDVP